MAENSYSASIYAGCSIADTGRTDLCAGCACRVRSIPAFRRAYKGQNRRTDFAPLLHRTHGRPHPGTRQRPDDRNWQPRRITSERRALRRVIQPAGDGLQVIAAFYDRALTMCLPFARNTNEYVNDSTFFMVLCGHVCTI